MLRNPLHDFEVPWPDEKRRIRGMKFYWTIGGLVIAACLGAAVVQIIWWVVI